MKVKVRSRSLNNFIPKNFFQILKYEKKTEKCKIPLYYVFSTNIVVYSNIYLSGSLKLTKTNKRVHFNFNEKKTNQN